MRPDGGLIAPTSIANGAATSGVWSLRDVANLAKDSRWVTTDQHAASVTVLLRMEGPSGSTVFLDSSKNNLTFAAKGGVTLSSAQKKFGATSNLSNGTNGWSLSGPTGSATQFSGDFTVEFWAYINAHKDFNVMFDTRASVGSAAGFSLGSNAARKFFLFTNNAFRITSSTLFSTATWYHVALTRSGSTWTLWSDGASEGTYSSNANLSDGVCAVGVSNSDGVNSANAYIDSVRVTKGVARYTAGFTPPATAF